MHLSINIIALIVNIYLISQCISNSDYVYVRSNSLDMRMPRLLSKDQSYTFNV